VQTDISEAYHCITGASGFQFFFPTLTATLTDNHIYALLLVAPPYIFMVFYSFAHAHFSDKFGNRFWFFVYPIPIVIAGFLIFMFANSFGAKYFSFFLMIFVFSQNSIIYSWIANAIPRPPAKRAACLAFVNSVGNAASIWTPFTYFPSSAPHYRPALGAAIGLEVLALISAIGMFLYTRKQNNDLDKLENANMELSEKDLAKLEKTAELEGVSVSQARQMAKGYRFMY